jgi:hypothetical protein
MRLAKSSNFNYRFVLVEDCFSVFIFFTVRPVLLTKFNKICFSSIRGWCVVEYFRMDCLLPAGHWGQDCEF